MAWVVAQCGPGKVDPWKKGLKPRRKHTLWPESFWKELCEVAQMTPLEPFSEMCFQMIGNENELLYGQR